MSEPASEEVKTDVSAPIADASENVEAEKAASLVANKVSFELGIIDRLVWRVSVMELYGI